MAMAPQTGQTQLLDTEETAAVLRVSVRTLYRLTATRKLPFVQVSDSTRLFLAEDIAAYVRSCRQPVR